MSTYRKFDKYRSRTDFVSDIEYGVESPSNRWIATGTGTPALTLAGTGGLTLATSAAAPDTTFIQRGIVSAATKASPMRFRRGFKFHAVTSLDISLLGVGGLAFGFAVANADPLGQSRVMLTYDPASGFTATTGLNASPKTAVHAALAADYVKDGLLDLEVYYDGTDTVQFFAGRERILKTDVAFDGNGFGEGITGGMSPTLGVLNLADANAKTVVAAVLGWAEQRVPARL